MIDYLQAKDILSSFDDRLRRYAIKQLNKVSSFITYGMLFFFAHFYGVFLHIHYY